MKNGSLTRLALGCLFLVGALGVNAQKVSDQSTSESFTSISRREIELMIAEVSTTNPSALKKLADPKAKKEQIESLKQLLAFASQAQKDGLASGLVNRQEMENIRIETIAASYDKETNKGDPAEHPFGDIEEDSIKKFWGQTDREAEFLRFLDAKTTILAQNDPKMIGRKLSEDERVAARDIFARTRIYGAQYEQELKAGTLINEFVERTTLKVKLQQAQFLARLYSDKVVSQVTATDKEVADYVKANRGTSKEQARSKLEKDKEQRLFDELIRNNNIQVPDDFTVPTIKPGVKNQ